VARITQNENRRSKAAMTRIPLLIYWI